MPLPVAESILERHRRQVVIKHLDHFKAESLCPVSIPSGLHRFVNVRTDAQSEPEAGFRRSYVARAGYPDLARRSTAHRPNITETLMDPMFARNLIAEHGECNSDAAKLEMLRPSLRKLKGREDAAVSSILDPDLAAARAKFKAAYQRQRLNVCVSRPRSPRSRQPDSPLLQPANGLRNSQTLCANSYLPYNNRTAAGVPGRVVVARRVGWF